MKFASPEYSIDMYTTFRLEEASKTTRTTYLDVQPFLNEDMRSVVIDWLKAIYWGFQFRMSTLYLATGIMDKFLQRKKVLRHELQLVAVTCLWIAYKYDDYGGISADIFSELVLLCDGLYTKNDVSS